MNLKSIINRLLPKSIKHKIRLRKQIEALYDGYNNFLKEGNTSHKAHMSLINLYCSTGGEINDRIQQKVKSVNPAKKITDKLEGISGSYNKDDFKEINNELNGNGYVKFEKKLPKDIVQRLYHYALQTGAKIPPKYDKSIIYDPENPIAEIYRFDNNDLVNNRDIQSLMMDPVLLNIARNYLECEPIFDFPAMWWSTALNKEASSEAAQLYHFDMDRIKWLKIFFYLNDVTEENGPHRYIEGSHKPGHKPAELLRRGYARISDADMKPYYKQEEFKILCAEAGTVFAGDTKCWHKGTPLVSGHRLVLEFEYTSSLFGANIPKMEVKKPSSAFEDFCMNNKIFASNIQLINSKS